MKISHKKVSTKMIGFILFIIVLVITTKYVTTYAYSINFFAVKFKTNPYMLTCSYTQGGSINYSTHVQNGVWAWNYSAARVHITYSPGTTSRCNININSYNYGNTGWHGQTDFPSIINNDESAIHINDYYLINFMYRESELVAHEIGHCFCLLDVTDTNALMRKSGYKGSPDPTADDIAGVNSIY